MADQPTPQLVPARYIGHQTVKLRSDGVYKNVDGTRRANLLLHPGDLLLLPETELRGMTWLLDFTGEADPKIGIITRYLGAGIVLLPVHQGLDWTSLIGARFIDSGRIYGYEFHVGRSDFQEADAPWPLLDAAGAEAVEADDAAQNSTSDSDRVASSRRKSAAAATASTGSVPASEATTSEAPASAAPSAE